MALAGWAPALAECAVCGTPGRHRAFSVPAGGAVCPDCRPPGAAHPAPATIDLMSALTAGDWVIADAQPTPPYAGSAVGWSRRTCSGTWSAALRSLPLVDRLRTGPPARGRR